MTHSKTFLKETAEIAGLLDSEKIESMVGELVDLRNRKGRLFIVGLGGSAANASHAANDFTKLCGIESYAPTDNVAELTARANDEGWHAIFIDWLAARYKPNDCVLVLSVGGGNPNVSYPIFRIMSDQWRSKRHILAIVGRDGGETAKHADCCIIVPTVETSRVTPHTEGWQSVILHAIVSHPDLQVRATKW